MPINKHTSEPLVGESLLAGYVRQLGLTRFDMVDTASNRFGIELRNDIQFTYYLFRFTGHMLVLYHL